MFIDKAQIIANSRYKDKLMSLDDYVFIQLINRADSYITMRCKKDYSTTTSPVIKQSIKTITWRLVDYFYYQDHVNDFENKLKGIQSESIGDYSYSVGASGDGGMMITGDDELDMLLDSLTIKRKRPMMFHIAGSGKRGGRHGF